MVVSPYVTFGVETEEKSFYKKQNQHHVKVILDQIHRYYYAINAI